MKLCIYDHCMYYSLIWCVLGLHCGIMTFESICIFNVRKKLDPLEAYVPAVLLTQSQFEELGGVLSFP